MSDPSSSNNDFNSYLKNFRVRSGEAYTHVSKGIDNKYAGIFYIEDKHIEGFWIRYCNEVRQGKFHTLAEKPGKIGPLRIDFDFKSNDTNNIERQYTTDILRTIVKFFQLAIRDIVKKIDDNSLHILWCIVLEKESPRIENNIVKDGFHIHFPYFICEKWIQDKIIIPKVNEMMLENGIWNKCNYSGTADKYIDVGVTSLCWLLYGSMNYKNKDSSPYLYNRWSKIPESRRFGHAFDESQQEISLYRLFEISMIEKRGSTRYWLPKLLSIHGEKYITPIKKTIKKPIKRKKRIEIIRKRTEKDVMEDYKKIVDGKIMSMINKNRSYEYRDWIDIGWTLFNIGEGREEFRELWIEFSSQCKEKFDERKCIKVWNKMEMRGRTLGSLLYIARKDSPKEYSLWRQNMMKIGIDSTLFSLPEHLDIAKLLKEHTDNLFICADPKHGIWYQFNHHRWNIINDATELKILIVSDILELYQKKKIELKREINRLTYNDVGDDYSKYKIKKLDNNLKNCKLCIKRLKRSGFVSGVTRMCEILFYMPNFMNKIDANPNLLCCENGVLDLENEKFREGRPEDYISQSTGINYYEYSDDDQDVKDFNIVLEKVYPDPELRNYFLDFMCSILKGGNPHKIMLVAEGKANGGKSAIFELVEKALGIGENGYIGKISKELLCQHSGRISSAAARPEIVNLANKRGAIGQEIDDRDKIRNTGFIKTITGGDSLPARTLYDTGKDRTFKCVLMLHLNVFNAPGGDPAFWSRVKVLPHESRFVLPHEPGYSSVPKTHKEQMKVKIFKADPQFRENNVSRLAPVLLWTLFHRYINVYKKTGRIYEPAKVRAVTLKSRRSNDAIIRFISSNLKKAPLEEAKNNCLTLVMVVDTFIEWYRSEYNVLKVIMSKSDIRKRLKENLGVISNRESQFYGIDGKKVIGYELSMQQASGSEEESILQNDDSE